MTDAYLLKTISTLNETIRIMKVDLSQQKEQNQWVSEGQKVHIADLQRTMAAQEMRSSQYIDRIIALENENEDLARVKQDECEGCELSDQSSLVAMLKCDLAGARERVVTLKEKSLVTKQKHEDAVKSLFGVITKLENDLVAVTRRNQRLDKVVASRSKMIDQARAILATSNIPT
jgi:bacterioferritin (cytochrome b1)